MTKQTAVHLTKATFGLLVTALVFFLKLLDALFSAGLEYDEQRRKDEPVIFNYNDILPTDVNSLDPERKLYAEIMYDRNSDGSFKHD